MTGNNKWRNLKRKPEDYKIADTVLLAKVKLCNKFNVKLDDFEKKTTRRANVIEARRFLIYFLKKQCNVRALHIQWFVPSLTHHATILHHLKKMDDFILNEKGKCDDYESFRYSVINGLLDN